MFKKVRDTIRQSKFSKEEFPGKDLPGDIDSNATLNKKMEPCEELAGSQRPTSGPTTNSSATIISRTIKETPPEEVSTSQAGKNVTIMPDLNIPHENDAVTGAASTTERISRKARNAMPSKSVKSSSSLLTNGPRKSSTCNSTGTILRSATTGAVPRRHGLNNFADRPPLRTDDSVFSVGSLDDDTEVPDEGDNLDKSADSLSSSKLESDFPFTEPAAPNKDRRATALPSEYGARAAQRYATLEKWSDGEASDTERDHLDSVKDASSVFEEDTTAFRDSKSASATPSTATKSGNGGSTMRRTTALLLNRRGSCAQEAFGKLRRRNVKRFSVMAAVEIADKLRPAAYQDENFHHKGEDFDKGDTTPVKGTATPSTPGSLEFEFADKSKFHLKQIRTNGAFDFKCMGKEKLFKGKSILKGVAKFKENPDKYIAMTYQKKMLTWPKNMQEYTFIHRAGTERLVPSIISDDGWMSVLMQKYIHLPTFPNDELPVESRDQYSHKMTLRKQPFTKKFILPGRGMGVCDTPLLKVIGDIDPSDTHQGSIGDCWLLSAISALAEFDGAVKKLFRKTPRLTECPLLEANQYTITLWDLETWTEVDIVVDESLPADPLDDEKLLASQPSSDAELWVCYLEKAFAVHCGGWDEIVGGQCSKYLSKRAIFGKFASSLSVRLAVPAHGFPFLASLTWFIFSLIILNHHLPRLK